MDKIIVIDFGGQYAHLIANRLRRLGFLGEIVQNNEPIINLKNKDIKGIILSGGPSSVYEQESPKISKEIFNLNIPLLGICYGHQLITYMLNGKVNKGSIKEYGQALVKLKPSRLFKGLGKKETVWMSHGDLVEDLPEGFDIIASSDYCKIAAVENTEKKIYGLQFHPEVTHTPNGMKILENFAGDICSCKKEWNMDNYLKEIRSDIKDKVKDKKVFLLVSGGVDSTVLFTLLNKSLGKNKVLGLHIDTGLMRLNESKNVEEVLKKQGFDNLELYDASESFLKALENVVDPEKKRKIIGNLFIDSIFDKSDKILSSDEWIIAQGTIYPDTIETKGTKNADLIKTHHNRVLKMQELINKGKVIEPLSQLYKDEVRLIGKKLGLPEELIERHPFPGPGLAVRILCNNKKAEDVSETEKKVKDIFKKSYVLPIKSVGVQGDSRVYKHPAVIDSEINWNYMEKLSTRMTNSVSDINRVLLIIRKKEGDFKLLKKTINSERVNLLQKADFVVEKILKEEKIYNKIWQMPVVLVPVSVNGGESIILRPVDSKEAMTANFSRIPENIVNKISKELLKIKGVDAVFYDITNKPPATIEWE
ncbi:glutamine-hydrolyzing GMP synthase [Candidatus Woesearchaeota archaeon]|nr:glutamine-hydrolyzing GMP synthase [Candidatus Woesearchaeota archaeon]